MLENELLIPPPNSIAQTVWHLAMSDEFNKHFAATATEFIYGCCAACAMAVVLGYLMGMYRWFELMTLQRQENSRQERLHRILDDRGSAKTLAGFKP